MCEREQVLRWSSGVSLFLLGLYALGLGWPPWMEAVRNGRSYHLWVRYRWERVNGTDLPVYFQGVRALGVTTAVLHLVGVVVTLVCLLKYRLLAVVVLADSLYVVSAVSTVALMGGGYRDDPRVKDKAPLLGFGFKLATACTVLTTLVFALNIALFWRRSEVIPSPVATVTRHPSDASVVTIDGGRKITIFRSEFLRSNHAALAGQGEKGGGSVSRNGPMPLEGDGCHSEMWLGNPTMSAAPFYSTAVGREADKTQPW